MAFDYYIDGIRVLTDKKVPYAGGESVVIHSTRIDDCIHLMKRKGFKSLSLFGREFKSNSIEFLNNYDTSFIENVSLNVSVEDITPLYKISGLKGLAFYSVKNIDLSYFPKIEHVHFEWDKKIIKNLEQCINLRSIIFSKFSEKDLALFKKFEYLEYIALYYSGFLSLNGIQELYNLKRIEIVNARKLNDINALNIGHKSNLKKLFIYNAPKLNDIRAIKIQDQLEMLQLVKTGEIDSIKFIDNFHKLEMFGFNSPLADGDRSPLKRFPSSIIPDIKIGRIG